jgi:hypothetical protein
MSDCHGNLTFFFNQPVLSIKPMLWTGCYYLILIIEYQFIKGLIIPKWIAFFRTLLFFGIKCDNCRYILKSIHKPKINSNDTSECKTIS